MSSKKFPFVYLLFCCSFFMAVYMNFNTPPDGYSGAPDEQTCDACHGPPADPVQMTIGVQGLPTEVVGGQSYPASIHLSTSYGNVAGFEAVSLTDDLANAGTWSNAGTGVTFSASNNRRYAKHSQAPPLTIMGDIRTYDFTMAWQPSVVSAAKNVTIWVSGVAGDGAEGQFDDGLANSSYTVRVYPVLSAQLVQLSRISCFDAADGSITVSGIGGKTPYDYDWSNGASGASIEDLPAGSYTVTISDQLGQSTTLDFNLIEPEELVAEIDIVQHINCNDANSGELAAIHTGGIAPFFYEWNSGQSSAVIQNLSAGFYEVSIYDTNNCLGIADIDLEAPEILSWELQQLAPEDCEGMANGAISIQANGGVPGYQYSWSNGANGGTLEGLSAGEYTLTITDASGCELVADFIIPSASNLAIETMTIADVSCAGGSDGQISVTVAGGVMPFTYEWNNGQSSANLLNVPAGSYTLNVTDDLGCTFSTTYEVEEPAVLQITDFTVTDANDQSGGSIQVSASGGTLPYSFSWIGPNGFSSNDPVIENLEHGSYLLTISDANGCIVTNDDMPFEVVLITGTKDMAEATWLQLYPNPAGEVLYLHTTLLAAQLRVFSLGGELIQKIDLSHQEDHIISTASWPNGVYFIQLQAGDVNLQERLIVVH